jgi:hypothetical protein
MYKLAGKKRNHKFEDLEISAFYLPLNEKKVSGGIDPRIH